MSGQTRASEVGSPASRGCCGRSFCLTGRRKFAGACRLPAHGMHRGCGGHIPVQGGQREIGDPQMDTRRLCGKSGRGAGQSSLQQAASLEEKLARERPLCAPSLHRRLRPAARTGRWARFGARVSRYGLVSKSRARNAKCAREGMLNLTDGPGRPTRKFASHAKNRHGVTICIRKASSRAVAWLTGC